MIFSKEKQCIKCKSRFNARVVNAKICDKCRAIPRSHLGLPTSTVGAIAELKVAIDLMQKGYEVFRALSPASSCDIAVLKNGKLIRVEVRTGYKGRVNELIYFNKNIKAELLAVVVHHTNEIFYYPSLNENKS